MSDDWVNPLIDWLRKQVAAGNLKENIVNGEVSDDEGKPIGIRVVVGIGKHASDALNHCVLALDAVRGLPQTPLGDDGQPETEEESDADS